MALSSASHENGNMRKINIEDQDEILSSNLSLAKNVNLASSIFMVAEVVTEFNLE
jgi:hypothetical protein